MLLLTGVFLKTAPHPVSDLNLQEQSNDRFINRAMTVGKEMKMSLVKTSFFFIVYKYINVQYSRSVSYLNNTDQTGLVYQRRF